MNKHTTIKQKGHQNNPKLLWQRWAKLEYTVVIFQMLFSRISCVSPRLIWIKVQHDGKVSLSHSIAARTSMRHIATNASIYIVNAYLMNMLYCTGLT